VRTDVGPAVGRRRLAAELRRLRTAANKTIHDVAEALECSAGKISRIETAMVSARLQDVREMLDLYAVGGTERDDLLNLVRRARQRAWWHEFADVVPPQSATFFGLEDGAASIAEHQVVLVPGLLQTAEYARALLNAPRPLSPDTVSRRLELRLRRQKLLDGSDVPTYHAVLDEAVLHRVVGGQQVMAAQLRHLVDMAERPRVTIQVLPFDTDVHTGLGMAFVIFRFADPTEPEIVYLEQLTGNSYVEQPADVGIYLSTFADACERALTPEDSVRAIARRADAVLG